jgi:hypothetical protein
MRNNSTLRTLDHQVENILGQFLFAFGQGAGTMRVQRATIAAFRARYYDAIQRAPGDWKSVSANVLGFVAQVGRLAAHFATEAGRTAIAEADFMRARQIVEKNVHRTADLAPVLIAGPYCSVTDGEPEPVQAEPSVSDPVVTAAPGDGTRPAGSIH